MNKARPYILSTISGILFGLTWNVFLPAFSLFFAFVPLIFLFQNRRIHYTQVFISTFFSFIVFHIFTVWWLANSSFFGFLFIIMINSFFMAIVMVMSFLTLKKYGNYIGITSLIIYWLSFEYIHYHWELSWPFMNLGNWLGQIPEIIQWYEYTGVLGGTLWILIANISVFILIKNLMDRKIKLSLLAIFTTLFIITTPVIISKTVFNNFSENGVEVKIKIIQPNVNAYTEKYKPELFEQQINDQIDLAIHDSTNDIKCYLFPESSFPVYLNESEIQNDLFLKKLKAELKLNSNSVLGGFYSFKIIDNDSVFYNTAFMINSKIQLYHKSKLVVGVEKMPFQDYLQFLKKLNLNFGGYTSSLNTDDQRKVFLGDGSLRIAPVICYESVYGQFVSEFINKGATSIAVITNDGWWGNTPGFRQHLMHSQLRAIETRKSVARAANTGLSCFINQKGEIASQIMPFKKNYLMGSVFQNNKQTFYTRNGDFIGKISFYFSLMMSVFTMFNFLKERLVK